MRVFGYGRVSTDEQTAEQQLSVIRLAGYDVPEHRWIVDHGVSGGVAGMERPEFSNLVLNKLEPDDTLVVAKLDRLGRDNIDVQQIVQMLDGRGIRVVILDLPVPDLSSANGRLVLQMFGAFAEFEKNRISERTKEKLQELKKQGVRLGRPKKDVSLISSLKEQGYSQSQVVKETGLSLSTVKRNWNK